ncbi:WRKY transcription factor 22-like [Rutidosis leptorrhynchoides]|uniref:WRKY transcription factor 22-like n=1 Tax=Rutidosis leptorrhynchoides TaxID=125765 RepID=UPI003A99C432
MENWGLQDVIRPKQYHDHHEIHHQQQQQQQQQHHHIHDHDGFGSIDIKKEYDQAYLFCFPDLFDHDHATTSTKENEVLGEDLDQLYKLFYPVGDVNTNHQQHHHDSDLDAQGDIKNSCGSFSTSKISQPAPKLKKRKNQQKRVVVQVTSDGLSSDPWAWRKYGQKPIKGSIYPRSYYRCSSSKGCLARRQVEQSCTDSSIYILTYTADHNHAQPTRRNSLAGINRNRFKATPKSPTNSDSSKSVAKSKDDSPFQSPTTHSASSIDDEVIQQSNIKQETMCYNNYDYDTMISGINDDDCMAFGDDFFEGLEDLGDYKMDSSFYNSSNKQFPRVFA